MNGLKQTIIKEIGNMIAYKKTLYILVFIIYSHICFAQTEIEGIKPCVDSLISNLNNFTKYLSINFKIIDKGVVFYDKNLVDTVKDEKISSLLEYFDMDSIHSYLLINNKLKCYAISSSIKQATGLAINFISWIIIIPKYHCIYNFKSLSSNPKLIFFDNKNNLQFIRVIYGESLFWNEDWDNVEYEIELNEINMDSCNTKIIEHKNSYCN
jgi:uncharacterized membrane protein YkgB